MAKTTAAAPDYAVPETDEQEAALRRALATAHQRKLQVAADFWTGETATKFMDELKALQATKLPKGSATQQNVDNLVGALGTMSRASQTDLEAAEREASPEPEVPPVGPLPIMTPVPLPPA